MQGRRIPLLLTLGLIGAACSDPVGVVAVNGKFEAAAVDFGDVQVGILMPYTLAVKNTGSGTFRVTKIEVAENFTGVDYEFKLTEGPFAIATNEVRNIALSFQPLAEMTDPVHTSIKFYTDILDDQKNPAAYTVEVQGRGVKSGLEIMPNPVDFGTVLIGSSKTLDVTITNKLATPVDVITRLNDMLQPAIINQGGLGRFELLAPFSSTSGSLNNDMKLAPDASITVQIKYVPDPSQEGREDRGRWTIANCSSQLCDLQVTLIGKGTNAAIECTPAPLDFMDVNPGVTRTKQLHCTNVASENVTVTGWSLDSGSASEYSVVAYNGTPSTVAAGDQFTIDTQMSPTLASIGRTLAGTLVITGRNPRANRDLTPARIPITGRAGGPDIDVAPSMVNFGQVAVGTKSKRRVLVQNVGYSDLTVDSVTGDAAGTNAFTADRMSFVVHAGEAEVIELTFTPNTLGNVMSKLIVHSDDVDEPSVEVPIQGIGVDLPPCNYTVTPMTMNFGIVQVLHSTTQGFRIENIGTDACLLNDIDVSPDSSHAFTLATGPETGVMIPAGGEKTVVVQYIPAMEGTDNGKVSFYISSPTAPNPEVTLRGTGSNSALLITPNEINFGKIGVDCSTRERTVTIYNTGNNNTRLERIEIPAGVSTEFEVLHLPAGIPAPPGAGASIAPGQSLEFTVRYHAVDIGSDVGFLHIFEAGKTDPYVVPLYGEGSTDPTNEDHFTQLETPQVDILFVVDNSGSMGEEQASLTANFQSFIQFADAQALDYRIAVVTTDMDGDPFGAGCPTNSAMRGANLPQGACGYFADGNDTSANPDWRLITPTEQPSPEAAFTAIASQGTSGSGVEQGLAAAYAALSSPIVTGWNSGFLRQDAYLALIFLSDEDDQSPNSVNFYADFFKSIKGFRNTNLFSASAITGDVPNGCPTAPDPGARYVEMANQTGGIFESICTQSWSTSLQNLGLSVFGYKSRFFLGNQPVPGSVEIYVDGVKIDRQAASGQVRWSYDGNTNSVNFAPLAIPEPGSEIVVRYQAECL
ncbi:MAG: choice-of-anchor D domain-containing protein [Myxococcota bacterium]